MNEKKRSQAERIQSYARLIEKQSGRAVRPYRADGYMNMVTRYGTSKDSHEHYQFVQEPAVPDDMLSNLYEGNGLFAKIIDAPAEEAFKKGFTLKDISDQKLESFYQEALDELDWIEQGMTALKWMRLFGGSIIVMLINDGGGLEDPLNWKNIKSIDDLRVYDRSVITPDYSTMFSYDARDPFRTRGSRLGMPEFYHINSRFGTFTVHESRCLVFQNGVLPENSSNSVYQLWGMPEYIRLKKALRDTELAHSSAPRMLDRSVQPVYKMKELANLLATEEGEDIVLKRMQVIDLARGLLNSLVIDSEGEDYDFKSFQFNGVAEVIDTCCNFLSALTNIPQTILFGRSPAGMNSTGYSDLENWYSFVGRIQNRTVKSNLRYLLSVIFQAGVATGEVDEVPRIKVEFNPLWTMSDTEQADLDLKRAQIDQTKAATIQTYVSLQAIDPTEVRRKLADSGEFSIDTILDEFEDEEDLLDAYVGQEVAPGVNGRIAETGDFDQYATGVDVDAHRVDPGKPGSAPANAPDATKLPQDMNPEEKTIVHKEDQKVCSKQDLVSQEWYSAHADDAPFGVGVLVVRDGKILCGTRHNDTGYGLICGPGGHGEKGETPEQSAFRETEEEFGISPKELIPIGFGPFEPESGLRSHIFLCTDFEGEPYCLDLEMTNPKFRSLEELNDLEASLFPPFRDSLEILSSCFDCDCRSDNRDGGPGSGNHKHAGRIGKAGGSSPSFDSGTVNISERGDKLSKKKKDNLLTLAGACVTSPSKTDSVRIRSFDGRHKIAISTEDADVDVVVNDGTKEIQLEGMHLNETGSGKGTRIFNEIVANGKQQGYEKITVFAGGKAGEEGRNGYYTWPRLGFDAPLPEPVKSKAKKEGYDVSRVSDFMATEKGRKYWKDNGCALELEFDLSDDSSSMKMLTKYMSHRDEGCKGLSKNDSNARLFGAGCSSDTDTPENIADNHEKPLDISPENNTIKLRDTSTDGAPKGNQNAAGPHKKKGSGGYKVSKEQREKITKRLVGQKSSLGTEVKAVSDHAFDRVGQRMISPGRIEKMLASADTKPDKTHPDRTVYDFDGSRLVLSDDGTVVSVMWRKK